MRAARQRPDQPPAPAPRGPIRAVDEQGGFVPHPSPASALQQRLLHHTAPAVPDLSPRARLGVIVGLSALLWGLVTLPFVLARLIA